MKRIYLLCGSALVLAACGGSSNSDPAPVVVTPPPSSANVKAGSDLNAFERTLVQLSGEVTDMGSNPQISWTQVEGLNVRINDADTLEPSFQAPDIGSDQKITLRLTADDGTNPPVSDDVTVFVLNRSPSSQGVDGDVSNRRARAEADRRRQRQIINFREVRTVDGFNNNVNNPEWGASFTKLVRLGDASYSDLIDSMGGTSRPSAREVSNKIVSQPRGMDITNEFGTSDFMWQWGQFIDHDIGITEGNGDPADIAVPMGDPLFDPQSTGNAVILFNRAVFDPSSGTSASDPREQENEITAWIDASMVYGSTYGRALALRESEDSPFLATTAGNLLPFNTSGQTNANGLGAPEDSLFLAGDVRANEQIGLTAMHTVFMREHNRLATILQAQYPRESGEEIYQRARRILSGKIQKITYKDYLPKLIGPNAIPTYSGYDSTANPGLYNEFSVAAFRHGHTMISEKLLRLDANGNEIADGHLNMFQAFFAAPSVFTSEDSIDPILRGLATQQHQKIDPRVITDLRNMLFGPPGAGGLDLAALNIQRGRDHGVPSYNEVREVMGLEKAVTWSDITSDTDMQAALADTYSNVDDIDLFVGGLAEDAMVSVGSQLGELFRELLVYQFKRLRDGDRFWYEADLKPEELALVESSTLAKIIRDNTGIGSELQDDVFMAPNP